MRAARTPCFVHVAKVVAAARAPGRVAIGIALLLPLVGCGTSDRMRTSSIPNDDYRVRHPILLAQDATSIDVFAAGSQTIDDHVVKQVRAFAEDYRQSGRGPITLLLPSGPGEGNPHAKVAAIRRAVASVGVRAPIDVVSYPVENPGLASPIRLSFVGLKAKVGDQCGQWPNDIASGSTIGGWENKPYYNLGCSTQSMIAAQTADPRDLVAPRGEEPSDTQIRSRAIESIRKGTDPATTWSVKNTSIGSVGAN